MIVGYARTSTLEQVAGFEAQKRDLEAAGCQECYEEQVSSVAERTELEAALKYVRKGDTFVVTKLDRLARSVRDLCRIVDMLDGKGVALRILNLGIDTGTATGKLVVRIRPSHRRHRRPTADQPCTGSSRRHDDEPPRRRETTQPRFGGAFFLPRSRRKPCARSISKPYAFRGRSDPCAEKGCPGRSTLPAHGPSAVGVLGRRDLVARVRAPGCVVSAEW